MRQRYVGYSIYEQKRSTPDWFLPFVAGILFGVSLFLLRGSVFMEDPSFFGREILQRFGYSSLYKAAYVRYLFRNRLRIFLIPVIAAFTWFFPIVKRLFYAWWGLSWSVILMTLMGRYKGKGLLLFVGLLFPHFMVYIPCLIRLTRALDVIRRTRSEKKDCFLRADKVRFFLKSGLTILPILLFWIIGILLESYVNPLVLKKIINFF